MFGNLRIHGSLLSLCFIAATVNAGGCIVEGADEDGDIDSQDYAVVCAGSPQWAENVSYAVGTVVTFSGKSYKCSQAHTSLAGWNPVAAPALWQEVSVCAGSSSTTSSSASSGSGGSGGAGGAGGAGGSGGNSGTGLGSILSEPVFNQMFPNRNPFYTYGALVAAANTIPGFATTGSTDVRKREVAAFLANVSHETGDLVYIEEIVKSTYCDTSWGPAGCGCVAGKSYYGRGPIQISWNGNYCAAGNYLGVDLKSNPDLVAQNATIAWRTGFWFWMTQTGAGSMTAHNAMVNDAGFGQTIRTINGALECNGKNPGQVQSRVNKYVQFSQLLGVSPGANTGC